MMPSPRKSDFDSALDKCENFVAEISLSDRIVSFGQNEMAVFTAMRNTLADSLINTEQANQASVLIRQVLKFDKEGKIHLTETHKEIFHSILHEIQGHRDRIKQLTNK